MSYDPHHPGQTHTTNGTTSTPPFGSATSPADPGRASGLAVAGFVCAITGGAVSFIPYLGLLGLPVLVVGLVLSAIELSRKHLYRGLATAGLVVCLTALPVNTVLSIATLGSTSTGAASTGAASVSAPAVGSTPSGVGAGGSSSGGTSSTSCPTSCTTSTAGDAGTAEGYGSSSGYSNADRAYLNALAHYGVDAGGDATAIGLGHAVCHYLSAGGTEAGAVQVITNQGASTYNAQIIVGAAEGAYCPTGT